MLESTAIRLSESCERLAIDARELADALRAAYPIINLVDAPTGHDALKPRAPGSIAPMPSSAPASREVGRIRRDDSLYLLFEHGRIQQGDTITVIPRLIPRAYSASDLRLRATIGSDPSRPVWQSSGQRVKSLTALSKTLRDELGILFPHSSFNACKYWYIEGQPAERTLAAIVQEMDL